MGGGEAEGEGVGGRKREKIKAGGVLSKRKIKQNEKALWTPPTLQVPGWQKGKF